MTNDYGNLELHQVLLAAMKDIDKICRENGLKYFLYAGTLLGAVQHKGFIPWDDDIDLAMLPDDFDQLAAIIQKDYQDEYTVSTYESDPNWYSAVNKIYINGTKLLFEHSGESTPFFIDICILHSVPDGKLQRFWQRKQLELIEFVWNVQSGTVIPTSLISKMTIGQLAKINSSFWNRQFTRVATKYDKQKTEKVGSMFCVLVNNRYNGQNGYERDITPRCWHESAIDIPFEDSMFMTLAEPIADIDNRYPNWRKPFPEKQRMSKHDVKFYEISPEVRQRVGI